MADDEAGRFFFLSFFALRFLPFFLQLFLSPLPFAFSRLVLKRGFGKKGGGALERLRACLLAWPMDGRRVGSETHARTRLLLRVHHRSPRQDILMRLFD